MNTLLLRFGYVEVKTNLAKMIKMQRGCMIYLPDVFSGNTENIKMQKSQDRFWRIFFIKMRRTVFSG